MNTFLKSTALVIFSFVIVSSPMTRAYALEPQPRPQLKLFENALSRLSLPSHAITTADLPNIQKTIQEALEAASSYIGAKSRWRSKEVKVFSLKLKEENNPYPLIEGLLLLESWLKAQGCIDHIQSALHGPDSRYSVARILISYPPKISIGINFKIQDNETKRYDLVFIEKFDAIRFVSFAQAK